jgi:hypothetical protein
VGLVYSRRDAICLMPRQCLDMGSSADYASTRCQRAAEGERVLWTRTYRRSISMASSPANERRGGLLVLGRVQRERLRGPRRGRGRGDARRLPLPLTCTHNGSTAWDQVDPRLARRNSPAPGLSPVLLLRWRGTTGLVKPASQLECPRSQSAWTAVPLCSVTIVAFSNQAGAAEDISAQLAVVSCQWLAMPAGDA